MKYNKYNNKKVEYDGYKFDSKKEAEFYKKLKALQKAGKIKKIEVHPKFELQPSFKKNGKTYRAINYYADFLVYYSDGITKLYDTKGKRTEVYKIKKKLFEYKYKDLTIEEV